MRAKRSFCAAIIAVSLVACGRQTESPTAGAAAQVRILQFYASPGVVAPGDAATICYGVESAASVRMEPAVESLTPSMNRCFQVSPRGSTKYTLWAKAENGTEVSESFTIQVDASAPRAQKAPAPAAKGPQMIHTFVTTASEISAGQPVTMCYGVKGAAKVSIQPRIRSLEPQEKSCFSFTPSSTATYTLTATGPDGRQEQAQLTVTVR